MLWPGGFLALEVTTSTPDALCPPLAEARAAVSARVGEVQGAYHAEYALIRAADGRQMLELSLRQGSAQVLQRELPLDAAGCQDAAQALALVLERYFDAVEKPAQAASIPEPIPETPEARASQNSSTPPPRDASASATRASTWRVRAGALYDLELGAAPTLGVAWLPEGLRFTQRLRLSVTLGVSPFLFPVTESVRAQEIRAFTLQGALALPLSASFSPWSVSIGPWAQLRFQRADGAALEHEHAAYRALPGFGGVAQLGWSPLPSWTLGFGLMLGAQAVGASSRFVLERPDTEPKPVLVPETAFRQAELTLALEL